MNYYVSDMISRIKNAALARRKDVILPYSSLNKAIATVLVKEHFLDTIKEENIDGKKALVAAIRYERRRPVLTDIAIVSKPSLRVYIEAKNIYKRQQKGLGMVILSTSKGVMTGEEAKKQGLGGELLFEIT